MQPTRVSESSQTINVLVVTPDRSKITTSGTLLCGVSDHYIILCTCKKYRTKADDLKTFELAFFVIFRTKSVGVVSTSLR